MKLINLKTRARLMIGFGIIVIFVALLAMLTFYQSNELWQKTDTLYQYPLQTARAVRELKADIYVLHYFVHKAVNEQSNEKLKRELTTIDSVETSAFKKFDIMQQKFLGDKRKIDSVYYAFRKWKLNRDEIIALIITGRKDEAAERIVSDNVYTESVSMLSVKIQELLESVKQNTDGYYYSAKKEKNMLDSRIIVISSLIFLLSISVSVILYKGIKNPLDILTEAAKRLSRGEYSARSSYLSENEYGKLSMALNQLAMSVQSQFKLKEDTADLAEEMMKGYELKEFCNAVLNIMMRKTESHTGAVYLLNQTGSEFEHYVSVGLAPENIRSFSAVNPEGEFGTVVAEKNIKILRRIEETAKFNFYAVTGMFRPREIITIPVMDKNKVIAVISIASLNEFSDGAVLFVKEIWPLLSARLVGVLAFSNIRIYSEKLDQQNTLLEDKSKELLQQSEELKEYNVELELQKKQLNEVSRLKSSFLSNMSHELRTPLNSVIALSGVLNKKLKSLIPDEEYRYLEIIEKNGRNLLNLINDILDLSRIEAGRDEINLSFFSLNEVIDSIMESLSLQASEKNIFLKSNLTREFADVYSDQRKVHHILQNLVSNAIKFTEEGSVTISAVNKQSELEISVADTGIGIESLHLPFIFDEFRQADERTSRKFGGTGLGLSIAKKYAMALEGDLTVESTPGHGSTFTLRLPVLSVEELEKNQEEVKYSFDKLTADERKIQKVSDTGKTILIVEDSEPVIIQLKDFLAEEGFKCTVAHNGREALEIINSFVPDAVILDLMMPEVDGFEVLKQIRNHKATSLLPVLILTAKHVTKEELSFLKGNNIHQLIQKGDIKKKELVDTVHNMFSGHHSPNEDPKQRVVDIQKDESGVTILVIEDNPDNLETVRAILKDNYNIISASNGIDGLYKYKSMGPDLVLLDISLPGLDGYRVLDAIREVPVAKHIPIIALTARAMKGDREEMLAYGFDGYIAKPVNGEELETLIQELLKVE